MWFKGLILSLAGILMLGFSLGCEPEQEDPLGEEPGTPEEGYEEPAPDAYEEPEGYEPPEGEGYEAPEEEEAF